MDDQEEIEYLVAAPLCCVSNAGPINYRLQDPVPFRDKLAQRLLELGATSEKRAIKIAVVGQWPVRCKAKLTATLQSDPSARFIMPNMSTEHGCVYLNTYPDSSFPEMAEDHGLSAHTEVLDALAVIDESSSDEVEEQGKRPLMAADKRRKIRKVIESSCCCVFGWCFFNMLLALDPGHSFSAV
jgi:hypothetical protein